MIFPKGFKSDGRVPITIVGAGPAGLCAAIVLARGGEKVLVREWRKTVGHRFHDDFQGLDNWGTAQDCLQELASHDIAPDFEHTAIYQTTAFDASGRAHQIKSVHPLYYLLRRGPKAGSLDRGLLAQAQAEGVEVRFNDRVHHLDGPAILATGPRDANVIATGYVFDTDLPDGSWFSLDQDLAPGGYAYLLVNSGRATMAACMYADFHQQALHVIRTAAFFTEKLGFEMRNAQKFGGFGTWSLNASPVQGDHLVVGEQAGSLDALAGFGLRYAMGSGILAARCILEQRDYAVEWRRDMFARMKTGVANRLIFETIGDKARGWALRGLAGAGADPVERLRRLYAADGLSSLAYPIAAWRSRTGVRQRGCHHADCDCVRCKARARPASASAEQRVKIFQTERCNRSGTDLAPQIIAAKKAGSGLSNPINQRKGQ